MADYFDRVKNEGYVDGKLTRDYNEYLRMGGWDMDKPGSNSSTSYQGKQDAINKRYDALIQSIKSKGQTAVTNQTNITSGELGKRGILSSSTLAGQEMQNAVQPVTQQYAGLEAGAEADRSTAIAEAIAQQQQQEASAKQQQFTNNMAQQEANKPFQVAPSTGGYIYDPITGALKKLAGSGVSGGGAGSYFGNGTEPVKPTPTFKPQYGPFKSGYSLPNSK